MPYLNVETCRRICKIHRLGKQSHIAPKKPNLRPQDFQQRLAFAHAHRHWTINNWAWVSRHLTLGKRSIGSMFGGHLKRSGNWKALRSTIDLVARCSWYGVLSAQQCEHSWMEKAPWICGRQHILLMEDNTPIHTAQASTNWQNWHNIQKLNWPAHSPDLNPIKTIWKTIKSQISKLYQPQMVHELQHAINAAWTNFHVNLLYSMPQQMAMVIEMNGGPTSY
ncbi:hypothetical protein O181_004165 [Austropuccinia psidii MF-1]|uniref:Tc1-like transposase DDE domain-containing protein n=1 Tax=Austropuccinia psidii MF-1 TaxID=1389203 RepID=A0A9Q3BFV1_9BASI|nr:hypothetical protein [Austropuccinia psidii MF-1]